MGLYDNLLTLVILLGLFLIIYLKITNQTLIDFVRALKELFSEEET